MTLILHWFESLHQTRGASNDRGRVIGDVTNATGKRAILVVRDNVYANDGVTPVTNYYTVGGGMAPDGTIRNRAEVESYIADFLSDKDANDYAIIWPN